MSVWEVLAPAKLTWSLFVDDRRSDGYHELRSEMVTLDLADTLHITEPGTGLVVAPDSRDLGAAFALDESNLIVRALELAGRSAHVEVTKRIPLGGGLGGGSADAGAVLRWAHYDDLNGAASLGGDVPFCLRGGRAFVSGIGEQLEEAPFLARDVVLLLPPFGVSTAAAYQALDELRLEGAGRHERNDLTEATFVVEPGLTRWRDALAEATGREVVLAGSGSTLFVEGKLSDLGLAGVATLEVDGQQGTLIGARTIPPSAGLPRNVKMT